MGARGRSAANAVYSRARMSSTLARRVSRSVIPARIPYPRVRSLLSSRNDKELVQRLLLSARPLQGRLRRPPDGQRFEHQRHKDGCPTGATWNQPDGRGLALVIVSAAAPRAPAGDDEQVRAPAGRPPHLPQGSSAPAPRRAARRAAAVRGGCCGKPAPVASPAGSVAGERRPSRAAPGAAGGRVRRPRPWWCAARA
jgi:hypothetical protein